MVTILHNKQCSTSRHAVEQAELAGVEPEIVQYLREPLGAEQLIDLIGKLEDEPTALVRRDSFFKSLELTDEDVATPEQVVEVLVKHPRLLQRPVIVKGDRAIIGRPKDRVAEFLSS